METIRLININGLTVRLLRSNCSQFPYEWAIPGGRGRRRLPSATSFRKIGGAKKDAQGAVDLIQNPPAYTRPIDRTNYRLRWQEQKTAHDRMAVELAARLLALLPREEPS